MLHRGKRKVTCYMKIKPTFGPFSPDVCIFSNSDCQQALEKIIATKIFDL